MSKVLSAVIVGGGLGGLCAAVHLKQAGFEDFVILEKAERLGGTWHYNTYPGCACDVPVTLYQFTFAPSPHWQHIFPRAAEVQAYTEYVAEMYSLTPNIELGTGAKTAEWDEARSLWRVTTDTGKTYEARAVVMSLGQLSRPQLPDIPGIDSFAGSSFHSAQWDHSVSYDGKRVCVVGSAASAVQIIPEVAKTAAHVTVFQRTPNWVVPRNDRPIFESEKRAMMAAPQLMDMAREYVYWNADLIFWQAFEYTEDGRQFYTDLATYQLETQVPDPVLRKKLTPDYPVGCKRILFTDDFYPALMRPNVTLVTDSIERISERGVVTANGATHEADIIVYATGFETTGWQWSVDIIGKGGQALREAWADAPEAYYGITVTGFPNMFMTYGPNTNLGHNSITFMMERQAEYIAKCMTEMRARDLAALEVTPEAQARFNEKLQARLAQTTWAHPSCSSWYKTADGRITQNWGWNTDKYREMTKEVAWDDYTLTAREPGAARVAE
jgi:cation diffusion facilitator CzcD-associated flavoprotein CzcO